MTSRGLLLALSLLLRLTLGGAAAGGGGGKRRDRAQVTAEARARVTAALGNSTTAAAAAARAAGIRVMRLDEFPRHEVALHFSCPESNMFATNCACHLRCASRGCSDAVELCEKYKESHGCRYVLLRGGASNAIATLKRVPTEAEARQVDLSQYPATPLALQASEKWSGLREKARRKRPAAGPMLGDLVKTAGRAGEKLVSTLVDYGKSSSSNPYSSQPFCPKPSAANETWTQSSSLLSSSISLVALSYQSPRTLLASMRSWERSGLLDMVSERLAFLSDPFPQDLAIAAEHGFRIVEPDEIPGVLLSKPNTLTIGAAFYYALKEASSEYVLFLENDFRMDESLPRERLAQELVAAAGLLSRGAEIVRLLSRKHQGCGTFKSCDHGGIDLESGNMLERRRNWFAFYCPADTKKHTGLSRFMSQCLSQPEFRCFTSWDSNWSLNAVLVKRSSMLEKKYPTGGGAGQPSHKTIADIGLEQYQANDGFESTMSWGVKWMRWRVPVCISYDGLFLHEEVETGA